MALHLNLFAFLFVIHFASAGLAGSKAKTEKFENPRAPAALEIAQEDTNPPFGTGDTPRARKCLLCERLDFQTTSGKEFVKCESKCEGWYHRNCWDEEMDRRITAAKESGDADAILKCRHCNEDSKHEMPICVICHEPLNGPLPVSTLPCMHCFHKECWDKCIQSKNVLCPICRHNPTAAEFRMVACQPMREVRSTSPPSGAAESLEEERMERPCNCHWCYYVWPAVGSTCAGGIGTGVYFLVTLGTTGVGCAGMTPVSRDRLNISDGC